MIQGRDWPEEAAMRRFRRVLQLLFQWVLHLLMVIPTVIGVMLFVLLNGGFRRNQARRALRPVLARLAPLHPRTLARSGDNGYVLNKTPWYVVYLSVDSRPDLDATLVAAARAAGYDLASAPAVNPNGWHLVNQTSTRLVTSAGDRKLGVDITRGGQIRVYAGRVRTWAQPVTPEPGRAILQLHMSLPRTDRSRAAAPRTQ
jgi:hypothetical protein